MSRIIHVISKLGNGAIIVEDASCGNFHGSVAEDSVLGVTRLHAFMSHTLAKQYINYTPGSD